MLKTLLVRPINEKRIQRIFRKVGYIASSKSKKEIIGSKGYDVRADRPTPSIGSIDLSYIHSGIDRSITYSMYFMYSNGIDLLVF